MELQGRRNYKILEDKKYYYGVFNSQRALWKDHGWRILRGFY